MAGIRSVMDDRAPEVEVYVEYLDLLRHQPEEVFPYLEQLYRAKYKGCGLDAIIAADDPALSFLLARRKRLFTHVPILFCGIGNKELVRTAEKLHCSGVLENYDLKSTVALALKLYPKTRHIVALTDYSSLAGTTAERFWRVMPEYEDHIHFQRIIAQTPEEMERALVQLPDRTVLINLSFHNDKIGGQLSARQVFQLIRQYRNHTPLFTLWDDSVELGAVGGMVTSGRLQGNKVAYMALQVLGGTSVDQIPVLGDLPSQPLFDYRQLRRLGIKTNSLPFNAEILNKPPNLFDKYKNEIFIVSLVFLALLGLVIMLASSNYSRKRALQALAKSRSRYRAIVEDQTDFVLRFSTDFEISFINRASLRFLGRSREDSIGRPLRDFVSASRDALIRRRCEALDRRHPTFKMEQAITPGTNKSRLIKWTCLALFDEQGNTYEYQAVGSEITELKKMQTAYRKSREEFRRLAMYLQDILEAERAAISREIHDEFGQNLTALSMGLKVLACTVKGLPKAAMERIEAMGSMVNEAKRSVQQLSQNLRPAELDNLGLEAAMRWYAEEFQHNTTILVDLERHGEIPLELEQERSTALYRVFQETLTNVARHADASEVLIRLNGGVNCVTLEVSDNGCGITSEQKNSPKSFGLIGMRERIRHLGGVVEIQGDGNGTRVWASVPTAVNLREGICGYLS